MDLSRTCSTSARKTQSITEPSYSTWTCPGNNCSPLTQIIRTGGQDAVCNGYSGTDNLIASFDQIGNMTSSSPTHNDGNCTVEGRYATPDDNGPDITVANDTVFSSDADKWCSLTKWYTGSGSIPSGCAWYAARNSHAVATNPVDLIENLAITIGADPSSIGAVKVELGKCEYTYTLPRDNSILKSTTNAQGTKDSGGFTIGYNAGFTYGGASYPSLRTALGATGANGLNICLDE